MYIYIYRGTHIYIYMHTHTFKTHILQSINHAALRVSFLEAVQHVMKKVKEVLSRNTVSIW